jgi:hypothetical protein
VVACTVNVALCTALPHAPVVVTETVCGPALKPVVSTVMLELVPARFPSTVHAYVNGPVPPAVVEKLADAPAHTV